MIRKSIILVSIALLLIIPTTSGLGTDTTVKPSLVIGGTKGTANSEFDEPDSVYISADGTIFAGDSNNLRVQVFDETGTYLREITAGFTPLAQSNRNEVQGIGELADGTLAVVEKAGNLFLFDKTTGTLKSTIDLSTIITSGASIDTQGLAVDSSNDVIYISNQPENMIYGIFANGTLYMKFSTGANTTPENIAISADYIYVSNEGQGEIAYYSKADGSKVGAFGKAESTFNFEGLAIDADGFIWVVDEGPDSASATKPSRIIMFSPDNFTALYAFGGERPGTAEGNFISPDGLAFDSKNNRLFIADQGNFRLQVFDIDDILAAKAIYVEPTTTSTEEVKSTTEESPFFALGLLAIIPVSLARKYRK